MAQVTRTTNPLPFHDLEPRRFEDLVRQLIYDFKVWRKLEATGRAGSDGSFDARGFEAVVLDDQDDQTDSLDAPTAPADRLWLVQCKRERSISPKKLLAYLNEIPAETRSSLYGVIFAAACDFSKATRDVLSEWARTNGISETYIWGKGELEDQLYQPKNDNLLFAYFGISLQIRKRSVRTALRSKLAMKKRAETVLGKGGSTDRTVLLRDPTDDRYPYTEDTKEHFRGKWRVVKFTGHSAFGLKFERKTHFAYVDNGRRAWDMVESINTAVLNPREDEWAAPIDDEERAMRLRIWHFWSKIPDSNRATFHDEGIVPYEDILAIDDEGDEFAPYPHVYIEMGGILRPIKTSLTYQSNFIEPVDYPDPADRIRYFPESFPEPPPHEEIAIPA